MLINFIVITTNIYCKIVISEKRVVIWNMSFFLPLYTGWDTDYSLCRGGDIPE